ncbi:Conidiation-specific protein 6 [Ascosphaera apis ARSEF 7405]|uniref:Conidiation-specific protein 6 n=1 Tax=Ascosphaera apis ARSEF 7405 TaxID=392613 RepID=A0A162IL89_9EURO|nr:Conidiation-specific protein 6 [Ascosphaera apis ARSEF 7405]
MLKREEQTAVEKSRRVGGLKAALHNPRVKERGKEQAAAKLHDLTSGSEADDDGSDFEE